ncbi:MULTISPECIES: GNAT family N-acetyltransferase [unclassified Fibrobacter]|uniref:GNAT family N-acetyltransferase n=1 Tax=unclassified Fibrobacter TaxID=2634177 RepID=UPI000D6B2182|nr:MULTISPECIES: GNAT family N-acetyltransferase [unclassified Fibrobacter]PWJ63375.1 L-amino acid N-acyltransferase YncA [Fibrobacter sp. UWR4]PZW68310.1 L-amino acid N-acyltransferase YncA [Fibrobacter sp. UWR1]
MQIRKATPDDFPQMLPIFREVIQGGDTYDFEETASDQDAYDYWFGKGVTSFVMEETVSDAGKDSAGSKILGFYKIIQNHRGRGSHVANASFMVSRETRGKGVGRKMGEDCIKVAREMGFKSIQFNFVISTNEPAMHLWKSLGFKELCRLPGAFNHKKLGFVDAVIFFMEL